jgi:SPP1 gp7 family putative phage head morphogenesis protein
MVDTTNEALFDAANRHQVFLLRFGGSSANRIVRLLDRADADLISRIRDRVDRLGPVDRQEFGSGLVTTRRLQALLDGVRTQNRDIRTALNDGLTVDLDQLAELEVDLTVRRLDEAIGVDLGNLRPSPEMLRAAVRSEPFRGRLLRDWVADWDRRKVSNVQAAIRLGLVEADTTPQIVRRVRQAAEVSKRGATALVRTSVNHIANRAREMVYQANDDLVKALRWTATLDSATTLICQARDKRTFPLDTGPRPPAHIQCRSIMTPVTRSWDELAQDGALKRGRGANNIDRLFERRLREQGFTAQEIAGIKRDTRAAMTGQVPGDLSYQDWIRRQPAAFQDDVLGPTKGALFRRGDLTLDRFVDMRSGREFTIDELRSKNEEAFMQAGV